MKKILILGLCGMFFLALSSCQSNNEKKYLGLKGKIEYIKDTQFEAKEKFGEVIPQDTMLVEKYNFNDQGQIVSLTHYNGDGEEIFSVKNEFKDGKCCLVKTHQQYNDISVTQTPVSITSTNEIWDVKTSLVSAEKVYIEFDKAKQNKTITRKSSDGKTINKTLEKYDAQGNLIENKITNPDGNAVYWTKSKFDENNQEIERKILAGGYGEGVFAYKYAEIDEKGNWTNKIEYKDGEVESITVREIKYSN